MIKKLTKQILIGFAIFLALASIFSFIAPPLEKIKEINLTELAKQINENQVKEIAVSENNLEIILVDGVKEKTRKESESSLTESLKNYGIEPEKLKNVNVTVKGQSGFWYFMGNILPFLLPIALIIAFIYFMTRQLQKGSMQAFTFGKSRARLADKEKQKITFGDVAGNDEAKEELKEVVEFLKYPKKFLAIGAKIPKGVLLIGAPGTGKTLLAKAVAGEAGAPFFHISGSEFVEMFVGVGASRVRDLFETAKKSSPCIVFIDEIDAVGRHRGAGLGGGHDEREQTLNQILVEMDGFETTDSIIVIAATNRPDILDPALLRPGRFDRRVILDQPDINAREAIIKIHAKNKPMEKDVNFRMIAERTPGFSGADLENLVNESAILAARKNKKIISQEELLHSIEKVLLGPERKSHLLTKKEKEITAYHEAGHALVAAHMPEADPVHKISIVSRGHAAGYTLKLPTEDKHLYSKKHFLSEIAIALGGYLAEKMIFGDITTGASNDLQKASGLARKLITQYGMSDKLGPITFGEKEELVFLGKEISNQRNYSETIAEKIDSEVSKFITESARKAKKILEDKKNILEKIAKILIDKETIEKAEFEAIIAA